MSARLMRFFCCVLHHILTLTLSCQVVDGSDASLIASSGVQFDKLLFLWMRSCLEDSEVWYLCL